MTRNSDSCHWLSNFRGQRLPVCVSLLFWIKNQRDLLLGTSVQLRRCFPSGRDRESAQQSAFPSPGRWNNITARRELFPDCCGPGHEQSKQPSRSLPVPCDTTQGQISLQKFPSLCPAKLLCQGGKWLVCENGPKTGTELPSCEAFLQKNSTGFETTEIFPRSPQLWLRNMFFSAFIIGMKEMAKALFNEICPFN